MITVILPTWIINEEILQLTKNTLDSLGNIDELIVIDNNGDQGGGFLRSKADVYVKNQSNMGYAYAVNQGLKLARNNLICISNNDVVPSGNWQEVAYEVLNDKDTYSCHFKMINYNESANLGDKVWYEGKERWCTSSFFVINTEKAKFHYDEGYFNSYDDYDYWYVVRSAGFKTAYTNKAFYRHNHSASKKYTKELSKVDKKNLEYFKEKWGQDPEELFKSKYPEQWDKDYWGGFE